MLRALYTLGWIVATPFAFARLFWRSRAEPGYRRHLAERLGGLVPSPDKNKTVWIHAVSVGETRAAQPLIDALLAHDPALHILLTHMTPTGRRTGAQLFAAAIESKRLRQAWLPYDLPWAVARFLRRARPALGLLLETEVWPNLLAGARRLQVPVVLVNGRLSPRSLARTQRFGVAATAVYRDFAAVLAQTNDDAQRYRAIGVETVAVTGNLKFDNTPNPQQLAAARALRERLNGRLVFCAASTREGEEPIVLAAWQQLCAQWAGPRPLLLLVPRHPQRFDEVAALAGNAGLSVLRRSSAGTDSGWPQSFVTALAGTDLLLGDSMGEMALYYALSDLALIGGSLKPLGGQNLIEAAAVGVPVVFGPHMFNFAQASRDALAAGAAVQIEANASALAAEAAALLHDHVRREQMATAARNFAGAHQGATRRTVDAIVHWLA